jgi:hypothetical protein
MTGAYLGNFIQNNNSNPFLFTSFGPDGNFYGYQLLGIGLDRYHGTTGQPLGLFTHGAFAIGSGGFTFGPNGDIYITNVESPGFIQRYSGTTGDFLGNFSTDPALGSASYPVFGPDGNLYVNTGLGIRRYNGQTGAFIDTFTNHIGAGRIAFGPDGNFYLLDGMPFGTTFRIQRYDGQTGTLLDNFESFTVPAFTLVDFTLTPATVPEPGSWMLAGLGILGLLGYAWHQCNKVGRQCS